MELIVGVGILRVEHRHPVVLGQELNIANMGALVRPLAQGDAWDVDEDGQEDIADHNHAHSAARGVGNGGRAPPPRIGLHIYPPPSLLPSPIRHSDKG